MMIRYEECALIFESLMVGKYILVSKLVLTRVLKPLERKKQEGSGNGITRKFIICTCGGIGINYQTHSTCSYICTQHFISIHAYNFCSQLCACYSSIVS